MTLPAIRPPRFTLDDVERAADAWGCNCGPAALAAVSGLTLEEVRPHLVGFEEKHYTNPSMMFAALKSIGRPWTKRVDGPDVDRAWPLHGLLRIQWEGTWSRPGVPPRARHRKTHWVGTALMERRGDADLSTIETRTGIFDVNCLDNGSGWVSRKDWEELVVPRLVAMYPGATGRWHVTHAVAVMRPGSTMTPARAVALELEDSPYLITHYRLGDTGVIGFVAGAASARMRSGGEAFDPAELRAAAKTALDEAIR